MKQQKNYSLSVDQQSFTPKKNINKQNKSKKTQTNKHASRLILNLSSETYYAITFQERNIIKKDNTINIF